MRQVVLAVLLERKADAAAGAQRLALAALLLTAAMAVASIRRKPLLLVVQERVPLVLPERTVLTM